MAQQTEIEATKEKAHPDIEKAAAAYVLAKEAQASASTSSKRRREELITKMQKHEKTHYRDRTNGVDITLDVDTNLKVKKIPEEKAAKRPSDA